MAEDLAKEKPTESGRPTARRRPAPAPNPFAETLRFFDDSLLLAAQTLAAIFRGRFALKDLINQMASIGVDAFWIVVAISVASGSVFALYTTTLATSIGFTDVVGGTLAYAFMNELGPVLGGIAFAARSGAAIAAEIGTMVVTEQVDALRAMAVSPIRYLVVPRVLSAVLMLPLLIVVADISGLGSGMLSASLNGIPPASFIASMYKYANTTDLMNGMIKAVVFAFIIGIVACQQGLNTRGGATGVGRSTTRSVVLCVVLITLSDVFLANLLRHRGR
jgi:phospholipid/cholesterol/gamma-HCH transport system permease protein